MLMGEYVSISGKKTESKKLIAPHLIFYHKDHSCIRIKPVVGGWKWGNTHFQPCLCQLFIIQILWIYIKIMKPLKLIEMVIQYRKLLHFKKILA